MNNEKCFSRAVTVEVIVGLFVALVFIALAIFTIVISGTSLFRNRQFPIKVTLPDAMGLRRNDAVIARGTTVGTVEQVYFDRAGVHVHAVLNAPVEFREGYRITVVSISILGGRQLVIYEGDPAKPTVPDVLALVGEQPAEIMDDATAAVKYLRDFLAGDFLEQLRQTAANLAEVSDRLAHGQGTLARLFSDDDTLYRNLDASVAALRTLTTRVEAGEGTLGKLFSADTRLYDDARGLLANLRATTDRLERGEGTLGRLLAADATLHDDLQATVADARAIVDRLEKGESALGRLLAADTAVYDDLAAVARSVREVSERLAAGQGTLGRLLAADSRLYDNLDGAVGDVREVIDDMREASPVSTFSSFIFGAF